MKTSFLHLSLLGGALVCAALAAACSSKSDASSIDAMCPAPEEGAAPEVPDDLRCTGLYTSWEEKTVAAANRPFSPASPLWSDGAEKHRWIQLPEGSKIDASNMDEWSFPIGTKTWKEFVVDGRRVETRFMWKVRSDRWLQASYVWSEDGTKAVRGEGAELTINGKAWSVPKTGDCNSCHEGRKDKVLGFEALGLALPKADGLTLAALVAEQRIEPAPAKTSVTLPDDGTGLAGPALAYLHTNCGISCHGPNDSAIGGRIGLRLRLGWDDVNGARPPSEWDALKTTVGVESKGADWDGKPRIASGDPAGSLLVDLVETRGPGQMPKLGTSVVDRVGVDALRAWIGAMAKGAPMPAGDPDADPADPVTTDPPSVAAGACAADSVAETETNDTPETANGIPGATGTYCGTLGSATDVDVVTFTAPADFKGLSMKLSSTAPGATVTISVNGGAPVTLGQAAVPAVRNGNYVVKISGAAGIGYRLGLTIRL